MPGWPASSLHLDSYLWKSSWVGRITPMAVDRTLTSVGSTHVAHLQVSRGLPCIHILCCMCVLLQRVTLKSGASRPTKTVPPGNHSNAHSGAHVVPAQAVMTAAMAAGTPTAAVLVAVCTIPTSCAGSTAGAMAAAAHHPAPQQQHLPWTQTLASPLTALVARAGRGA